MSPEASPSPPALINSFVLPPAHLFPQTNCWQKCFLLIQFGALNNLQEHLRDYQECVRSCRSDGCVCVWGGGLLYGQDMLFGVTL